MLSVLILLLLEFPSFAEKRVILKAYHRPKPVEIRDWKPFSRGRFISPYYSHPISPSLTILHRIADLPILSVLPRSFPISALHRNCPPSQKGLAYPLVFSAPDISFHELRMCFVLLATFLAYHLQ
ncbi:hypothetical protein R5R35_004013 [Gryllus longicercus]|uniref:Accessory gland protein n=1 Tax=Gryllus longicercus TaxID=2509291 RepID=A0AAN9Z9Q1_9ORTH